MKTAYLVSLIRERIDSVTPVRVREQWDPSDGPYSDHVPFAVGSNQYLVEQADLSGEQLRVMGDPLEAHGLYRTYLEEFEGGTDQDLCEYVHRTVERAAGRQFLRLVWQSATEEERQEFEDESAVLPEDPDVYRGYMVTCCRLIDFLRTNHKGIKEHVEETQPSGPGQLRSGLARARGPGHGRRSPTSAADSSEPA